MACAGVFSATILLLAAAVFASVSGVSHPLTAAAEATDHAIIKGKSDLLPVHNDRDKEEMEEAMAAKGQGGSATQKMTSLVSAEEEGRKKTGSYWGKARKLDDDDDDDDDDEDDSDHGSDSGHDQDHDSDSDQDHDSDSDRDHEHDSKSDNNDDGNHRSENEESKKKHAAQGRKGAPGGKHDGKAG